MIKVRIPATSANLGPGFDCMGLALKLYNTITVEVDKPFEITLTGPHASGISTDKSNLIWQTMCHFWHTLKIDPPSIALSLDVQIPPARGLGSSSTAIVGGLMAANAVVGSPLSELELLEMANTLEGHPDNVTPALLGGVTLSLQTEQGVMPRILARAPKLKAVAVIPNVHLKTEKARGILPPEVPRRDAVFNIAHVGLMVEAFIKDDYELLTEGMKDKLHQDKRAVLMPGMHEALKAAIDAGAYGSALSGSGPTLLALCPVEHEERIAEVMVNALKEFSVDSEAMILDIDPEGAKVLN